ncbi:MAG: GTP-binding protein [Clostridiales bacterium]|nr:GTP-binding protein [Clostridiales bacterium]
MKNIYLVTGFLGAGKTSFVNNFLKNYNKKVAVIVNEFGEINIDSKIIHSKENIRIHEINNGSIFCCCRMLEFANALVEMAKLDIETIVVEASGLADPANLEDIISGANARCDNEYSFMGSLCLVDARNYLKLSTALPALVSQVQNSNYLLINKSDLVDEKQIVLLEKELKEKNPKAQIIKTTYGRFDELPHEIKELKPSSPSLNTPMARPDTKVIHPKPLNQKRLDRLINKISKKAYRAKGFVTLDGKKKYIDIVGDQLTLSDIDEAHRDEIVLLNIK